MGRVRASKLSTSTPKTVISMTAIPADGRSECLRPGLTCSILGIASCHVSLVKIPNSDPKRGSPASRVAAIRSRARCWQAGRQAHHVLRSGACLAQPARPRRKAQAIPSRGCPLPR